MAERLLLAQVQLLRGALDGHLRADAADAKSTTELPWRAGDRVTASVEGMRPGERMLLRVGGYLFDAPTIPSTSVGQKLELVFVSASPRVTFALSNPSATQVPPQNTEPGKQVDISNAARRLETLINTLAGRGADDAQALKAARPLLPGLPSDPTALAAALRESVSRSGVFYESHLEHWAEGRLPLERIRQEPQGRLAMMQRADAPDTQAARGMQAQADNDAANPLLRAAAGSNSDEPVHPATLPQVKAQLEILQSGQINWQGQLWPGQEAELKIEEDPPGTQAEEERVWTSRLRLAMPRLGEVTAELLLSGQQLRIRLNTVQPEAAADLAAAQQRLGDRFAEARLQLVEFNVGTQS
ncbi:MAG: flagellar hook-length control protein FliK [Burkholderiales bacterium]|nr:flagellar hook-length control protein FliK [Burkholderiales bacterium]